MVLDDLGQSLKGTLQKIANAVTVINKRNSKRHSKSSSSIRCKCKTSITTYKKN
jgi:hypothetical protein